MVPQCVTRAFNSGIHVCERSQKNADSFSITFGTQAKTESLSGLATAEVISAKQGLTVSCSTASCSTASGSTASCSVLVAARGDRYRLIVPQAIHKELLMLTSASRSAERGASHNLQQAFGFAQAKVLRED